MSSLYLTYLNALDVKALALSDDEILAGVEEGLTAQGHRETVIEPRMHLIPDKAVPGHFNILRGAIRAPINLAGVKVISDYVDNYKEGLPSELGLLLLMDPANGAPKAIIDGSHLTDMRTGAVTAIGAKHLARNESKILGHVGARGTAYWNVRLLDRLFDFDEIRVHSRRPESREAFSARLARDLGKPVKTTQDWRDCVEGADIIVEASRLTEPAPMLKTAWIKRGAFVVPYGTMSAVELSLTDIMDKIIVDDWGQCKTGQLGSLALTWRRASSRRRRGTLRWARSSPGKKPGASGMRRPSYSGTAACRFQTSRSVPRCSIRRRGSASGNACAMLDRKCRR